ncbi:adenosylcobinamide amidohydrolase [Roseibacterium sp. SDUM158017]|uniref:adenosylcobinamide amidohydrolase n=1 Tax=Roseicyclus salinarum TaxID=3036773 RepID=UPI0024154110|nr:adenosylcobinamide amidohydrolase [Roseibacterium sp. SDUM158017]MDG4647004.1 adenosylcobinamide amidohydrolase [Roseibacterium sp. SDUM158017]
MMRVTLERPWLTADLDRPCRMLGWAPHNPGFVTASRVVWREVRDADLTEDFDALGWLAASMDARGDAAAVGLLTSRDLARYRLETACSGLVSASCLATIGLTNAERVGHRLPRDADAWGTINILAATDAGLSDTALTELLSIVAEARTAAVIDHGPDLLSGRATGTGTDCIVVAAPAGPGLFAGLHTDVGEAVGAAVYRAVAAGTAAWMREQEA